MNIINITKETGALKVIVVLTCFAGSGKSDFLTLNKLNYTTCSCGQFHIVPITPREF